MEIQEDVCLNGGSREQACGLAQQFIEQVSAKLN